MQIKDFIIDNNSKVFIIAELSANHNGSLEVAIESVRAAKRAGADCIKFQTYTADTMTLDSEMDDFVIKGTIWNGQKLYDLYQEAFTPWEWHKVLFETADKEGLICMSTPFDKSSVDFLETLNVPAYKIASFEITDIPLIEYVASKGKPVIISTGIATDLDVELAIDACKRQNNDQIALLKCTSSYPAPIDEANLCMIRDFSERYDVVVGLSDHTLGLVAPIVSTVFGAKIIEKHFIIDRSIGGPDAAFSMNEIEFRAMVDAIRQAEESIGKKGHSLTENQIRGRECARSIYVVEDVKAGDIISERNIRIIRPNSGLHPKFYSEILGRRFLVDLSKGSKMSLEYVI
jgi:pseudaminic acid synthase